MTHNNYQKLCGVLWLTLNETLFAFINKVLFWYWVSNVRILLPMHISVFESLCVNWSKDSHSVKYPLVRSCILCIERLYCMFIFCSLLWKLFFFSSRNLVRSLHIFELYSSDLRVILFSISSLCLLEITRKHLIGND